MVSVGEAMQALTRRAALPSLAPATAAAQALLMSIPAQDVEYSGPQSHIHSDHESQWL